MCLHEFNVPLRFHLTQEAEKIVIELLLLRIDSLICPVHTYIIPEIHPSVKDRGGYSGYVRVIWVS